MKKLLFSFLAFLLASGLLFSQEEPSKALTKAGRALSSYRLDNSGDKLKEAVDMIEIATKSSETNGSNKTWQTRGEIYNAVSDKDIAMMSIDTSHKPEHLEAPVEAATAFAKALELAQKKYETKEALKGLNEAGGKLNIIGNTQIKMQDYAGAFKSLDKMLEVNALLVKNGEKPLVAEADMTNTKFVVAYVAQASGNTARAKSLFKEMYDNDTKEASVYASYGKLLMDEKNETEALAVLNKGREKFPDDTEILFSLINYFMATGNFAKLEGMLLEAQKKEPDNPSVYNALGNVYMQLFNKDFASNIENKETLAYFDKAMEQFNKAVAIDANQFDALYSIGSLYFNRAVELVKVAALLPFDKAGQEKYKKLETEWKDLFGKALPYFKKTESADPNDTNTLIALGEIYARLDDLTLSKEFKTRLENVKGGGSNTSSYFKG